MVKSNIRLILQIVSQNLSTLLSSPLLSRNITTHVEITKSYICHARTEAKEYGENSQQHGLP